MRSGYEILRQRLNELKKTNKNISLRWLARRLDVSPSFISRVFAGKSKLPLKLINRVSKILKLDDVQIYELKNSLLVPHARGESTTTHYRPISVLPTDTANLSALLKDPYLLYLMDLLTCENMPTDALSLATRLGLSTNHVKMSLAFLRQEGWITESEGRLHKNDSQFRISTSTSLDAIRNFHQQVLNLGLQELKKTDDEAFKNRLICNLSVAVNPDNLEMAKEKLHACLYEIAQSLGEGPCKKVYNLGILFFPVSK